MARAKINFDVEPIHPLRVCEELRDFGGRDASYIIDGGYTTVWAMRVLPAERPGDVMGTPSGPMGCLGVGLRPRSWNEADAALLWPWRRSSRSSSYWLSRLCGGRRRIGSGM